MAGGLMGGGGGGGGSSNLSFNYPGIELPDIPALLTAPAATPVPQKKIADTTSSGVPWWQNLTGNQRPVSTTGPAPSMKPVLLDGSSTGRWLP